MIVEGNIQGNNVEIILLETAKSIAAYEGRTYINIEDIKEASEFVLTHRVREKKQSSNQKKQEDNNEKNIDESLKKDIPQEISKEKKKNENNDEFQYSIGKTFKVQKLEIDDFKRKRLLGSGKRCKTISDSLKGRYIKSIIPKGKVKDLAFDATLRAAAPYQNIFKNKKLAIVIKKEHIREKVREKRVGVSILFTVDASGSMGANERMVAVKGAILSLLKDAYEKRDRVGMVSFRRDRAEELLPITRSIELASKNLEKLSTGGNTPLYKGLEKSYTLLKNEIKKNPKVIPVLVLITDGKINTSKGESFEKLLKLCNFIKNDGIKSIVIDSEIGRIKLNMAKEICKNLDGKYYKLEDLKRDSLSCIVRENI
uniref:VWA domain-containing protein n=1 Tax=uncultured Cetobacterium sp. TaxID=527638 RepID=UPI002636AE0C